VLIDGEVAVVANDAAAAQSMRVPTSAVRETASSATSAGSFARPVSRGSALPATALRVETPTTLEASRHAADRIVALSGAAVIRPAVLAPIGVQCSVHGLMRKSHRL
jgi:hypothetical protein